MKKLKPGQLFTIGKHVYRCMEITPKLKYLRCEHCKEKAGWYLCSRTESQVTGCIKTLGWDHYPVLVK